MLEKIQKQILRQRLWRDGEMILVGVSGGPDSVALLDALRRIGDVKLHVCHLNHLLRGAASEGDERFVRAQARKHHLPCHIGRCDVRHKAKAEKLSLEEAAREARLEFFAATARKLGARKVALAHNADDQAETFLLRLIRGAGARGLGAMRPRTKIGGLTIVRPLLEVTRREILDYLRARGLRYRTDRTNKDVSLLRNRIRHKLLPLLEREYSAGIRAVLRREAEILGEEDRLLDGLAMKALRTSKALKTLPLALRRRVVRLKNPDATFEEVEGMLRQTAARPDTAKRFRGYRIVECFDANKLGRWSVRFWRAGDRMRPLGMRGHKKLQDIFTDAKIPAAERARIPLVIAEDGAIAWVVGVRMSDEFKVTARTRRRIRLSARRVARSIAMRMRLC